MTTAIACLAILATVPEFIAGWLVGVFRELRLARRIRAGLLAHFVDILPRLKAGDSSSANHAKHD